MKQLGTALVVAAAAFAVSTSAVAAQRKPGLWESTFMMNFTKGGPQIPPEQLEKMKQMGIQLPFLKPTVTQICITPEMAAKDDWSNTGRGQDDCQMKNLQKSDTGASADMVCNGEFKGTGSFKVAYDSNSAYHGTMEMKGTSAHSGPIEMNNTFSGRWVADSCGSVKPIQPK